jgi:hypothetical protein
MAAAFLVIFLTLSVIFLPPANAQAALGCGPVNVKFDVTTKFPVGPVPAPTAGKALVVFLQDDYQFGGFGRPTTRFGIDGTWTGATHANSYFYVSVDPGEHHVCASWQSSGLAESERSMAALHFTAEAGKSYYFRARDVAHAARELVLSRLDSDEAQVIINSFSLSSSHPKK